MDEKIVIHYRQPARGNADSLSPASKGRGKTRYLHDNRIRDALAEYTENLED